MKRIFITLAIIASTVTLNAATNSFTGLSEGTAWESFADQLHKSAAKKATFAANLYGGTNPADAGAVRLDNAAIIAWEASPAGTDVTLTVNSSEQFVFSTAILSPTFITPALGTPASGVATNLTGTASGLTAGNVTTNANLTGHVTSVGNAAVLGSGHFTASARFAA